MRRFGYSRAPNVSAESEPRSRSHSTTTIEAGSTWLPTRSAPMRAGDVVRVDFGVPQGSEPGFVRPAVVLTADNVLRRQPRTVHVVPLTSNTQRHMPTDVLLEDIEVEQPSTAQVHLCTAISTARIVDEPKPDALNVGPVHLAQMRSVMSDLLDLP